MDLAQRRNDAKGSEGAGTALNRRFGLELGLILAVIAAWGAWREDWTLSNARIALFGAGGLLVLLGLAVPVALTWPRRGWTAFGNLLQKVFGPVLLTVFFIVVITPVGLFRRLFGADPMGRRRASPDGTYWKPKAQDERGLEKYTHPF